MLGRVWLIDASIFKEFLSLNLSAFSFLKVLAAVCYDIDREGNHIPGEDRVVLLINK
jgi:hypothetical protein